MFTLHDCPGSLGELITYVVLMHVSIVLSPGSHDDATADDHEHACSIKRSHPAQAQGVNQVVAQEASDDGGQPIAQEHGPRKDIAKQ